MTTSAENPLLEKLVLKLATEQTRARRWSIFFKLIGVFYLFLVFGLFIKNANVDQGKGQQKSHTGMVRIDGMIGEGKGMGVSADQAVVGLRKAFKNANSQAVLLRINSPGGTPVNAAMIYDEILRLKKEYPDKKVAAAITDMGTSGAYYIAAAADEIYAHPASVIGSIGVIAPGFGFVGLMEKLGVERRIFSAGDNKAMLDPFGPVKAPQKEHFGTILSDVHKTFVTDVTAGREGRLADNDDIFSGLFWSGTQAKELGLIDGFHSPGGVAREVLGFESIVDYTTTPHSFDRLFQMLGKPFAGLLSEVVGGDTPPLMAIPSQSH